MFLFSSQFPPMHICRAILEKIWVPYSLLGCSTKRVEGGGLDGQEPFRPLANDFFHRDALGMKVDMFFSVTFARCRLFSNSTFYLVVFGLVKCYGMILYY